MDVPSTYLVDWLSWIKEYFKLRMFWSLMKETTGVLQAILLKQDTARLPASQWKQVCVNHSQFWKETEKLFYLQQGEHHFCCQWKYTPWKIDVNIFFSLIYMYHWQWALTAHFRWSVLKKKSTWEKEKNKINCTAKIIHFHRLFCERFEPRSHFKRLS